MTKWTCHCGVTHLTGTYCGKCDQYAPGVTNFPVTGVSSSTEGRADLPPVSSDGNGLELGSQSRHPAHSRNQARPAHELSSGGTQEPQASGAGESADAICGSHTLAATGEAFSQAVEDLLKSPDLKKQWNESGSAKYSDPTGTPPDPVFHKWMQKYVASEEGRRVVREALEEHARGESLTTLKDTPSASAGLVWQREVNLFKSGEFCVWPYSTVQWIASWRGFDIGVHGSEKRKQGKA